MPPIVANLLSTRPAPTQACGPPAQAGVTCESIFRITGNPDVARMADVFVARPAKIGLVLLAAWLGAKAARRGVHRFTRGLGAVTADVTSTERSAGALLRTMPRASARATQRAETIGALLGSAAAVGIWTIALFMVLAELGLQLAPLLAGAGIVGIALGFGAQNLVRDFLTGIFMRIEDQYGVGDVIDAGPATGTVEGVSLRTTRLRDLEGNVWHIPNGVIERVANKSQEWSRALLDISVAYQADTGRAAAIIKEAADAMWEDPAWSVEIVEEPEVWGVEELGADGVVIRLVVTTRPLSQWKVGRELRARVKAALDAAGIEIPFPQRVVWHRSDVDRRGDRCERVGVGASGGGLSD